MTTLSAEALRDLKRAANSVIAESGDSWYDTDDFGVAGLPLVDAEFAAAASPDVILALLAERERLAKDAARYQWLKVWQKTDGFDDAAIDREIAVDAALAAGEE